eukprot:gene29505-39932_t
MTSGEQPQGDIDMKDTVIKDDAKSANAWSISGPGLPKEYHLTASRAVMWMMLHGKAKVSLDDFEPLAAAGVKGERLPPPWAMSPSSH